MRSRFLSAATFLACCALAAGSRGAPCGTAIIPQGIGQGAPTSPTSLNPLLNSNIETLQAAVLLYRPLVWIGRGGIFDRARSLAAAVEPLDGNTRFRVTLKPWRWSDGTAVTAADVLFAWDLMVQLGDAYASRGQGGVPDQVARVRAVAPLVVDFELRAPLNPDWFMLNGLPLVYAFPQHAWHGMSRDTMWQRQSDPAMFAISDGPFVLRAWQLQRFMVFEPNPFYGGHPAALARLVVVFPEYSNTVRALRAGELDMARLPFALLDRLRDTPGFHTVLLPEPFGYNALAFNQASARAPFLRDAAVRRALTDATDQATMIRLVYHGLAGENRVPIPFAAVRWRRAAVPGALPVRYDPALAQRELDAAGWHAGPDGVRRRDGRTLDFTVLTDASPDGVEMQMLQLMQADLAKVGVSLKARPLRFDQLVATVFGQGGDWDAAVLSPTLVQGVPDGTTYFDTGGSNNWGGFSDPKMDGLIAASVRDSGTAAMFAYEDYAAEVQPVNILPQGQYVLMAANRLRGVEEFVSEYGLWSPEYLSVTDPACVLAPGAQPGQ